MVKAYFSSLRSERLRGVRSERVGAWIDVFDAKREDLEKLVKLTGLSYDDLKDGLDEYEMPRIERKNGKVIVVVRSPSSLKAGMYTETLMLVLTESNLITISPYRNKIVRKVIKRKNREVVTTQKTKLALLMLLEMAYEFTRQLKEVRSGVMARQEDWKKIDASDIARLTIVEEVLNQYLSALVPMRNVFEIILSGTYLKLHKADSELFDDVLISIRQSVDVCSVSLKSIRSIRDAHQIIFTNRLNRAVKLLTSLTVILTIPTIMGSLYGMNVSLPFGEHPLMFWWVVFGSLWASLIVFLIFWWKRWL